MPTAPLDAKDELILTLLEADARMPIQSLAAKIGLSRSSTHDRLARLKRDGVIAGFTIRRGEPRPQATISAYLILKFEGPFCERVAKEIEHIPQIKRSQSIGGEIDMILQTEAASIGELNAVRDAVERIRGVVKVTTGIVLADRFNRT